jgi:hypothetical protein
MKKTRNPHWRERWTVFALIYALIWFASLKQLTGKAITTDILALMLITVFTSALVYFLIGRIVVWVWLLFKQFAEGFTSSNNQAAQNRAAMNAIAAKLALEPTPVTQSQGSTPERMFEPPDAALNSKHRVLN